MLANSVHKQIQEERMNRRLAIEKSKKVEQYNESIMRKVELPPLTEGADAEDTEAGPEGALRQR